MRPITRRVLLTTSLCTLGLPIVCLSAEDMHKGGGHHSRFDDPKKWSATFDDPA